MKNLYIGIDLGGTSIKIGYGSIASNIISFETIPNTSSDRESLYKLLEKSVCTILNSLDDTSVIKAIGFGSPGVINTYSGDVVANCPNIKGWVGANPKEHLQDKFAVPVYVENDADLMTYGESLRNDFHDKNIMGITIGTGIGSGFVYKDSIFHNEYSSLELGHTIVVPSGIDCLCGKKGCLEAYGSVSAILREVKRITGKRNTLDDALNLYKQGNNDITTIINRAYDLLALAAANAVMILGAEVIIIGGGMTESIFFDISPLAEKIKGNLNGFFLDNVSVETATLKNKAAVYGGIALAEKAVK